MSCWFPVCEFHLLDPVVASRRQHNQTSCLSPDHIEWESGLYLENHTPLLFDPCSSSDTITHAPVTPTLTRSFLSISDCLDRGRGACFGTTRRSVRQVEMSACLCSNNWMITTNIMDTSLMTKEPRLSPPPSTVVLSMSWVLTCTMGELPLQTPALRAAQQLQRAFPPRRLISVDSASSGTTMVHIPTLSLVSKIKEATRIHLIMTHRMRSTRRRQRICYRTDPSQTSIRATIAVQYRTSTAPIPPPIAAPGARTTSSVSLP
jgi:hypothetical protein